MPQIGKEEERAVLEVLRSGFMAQGPRVREFEERFSAYIGTEHGIATNSGTSALHTALLACGIGPGDKVVTTPFTFIASANSILYCGAKPVFADIDERTFNIDPEDVKERITPKTKALLIVHLYGQPCHMDPIIEICEDHNLRLIEDACQAHGAEYKGQKVGSFGDAACFSFYPTKNMTTGEGGMIATNNDDIAKKARLIREHGSKTRYHHETLGYNYRMTDIAAAIGIEQLKKLDGFNEKRIENAKILTQGLKDIDDVATPYVAPDVKHVFHQYTIRVRNRDEVIERLEKAEIGYGIHYPIPVHKQRFYRDFSDEGLPMAEEASKEVLSLPVHPHLSREDIEQILKVLR
jgi:dTDP-4-amino-4,6-dideoxygalactose transaminase